MKTEIQSATLIGEDKMGISTIFRNEEGGFPTLPPPSEYEPEQFVNRQIEINEISDKVRQAQFGSIKEPIINYWGVSGIGKSWFLRHISDLYKFSDMGKVKPTFSLLHGFKEKPQDVLSDITNSFASQFLDQLKDFSTPENKKYLSELRNKPVTPEILVNLIREYSRSFIPLVLFDDAQLVEDWEEIELKIIEPIVVTNRVLVVIAGRKEVPHWHRFEVRRRVTDTDKTGMKAFSLKDVKKQLVNRNVSLSEDMVFKFTAGSPRLTDAIAEKISLDNDERVLAKVLREAELEVLSTTPENLRTYIIELFSLRYYQINAVRFYYEDLAGSANDNSDLPDVFFLNLLRDLESKSDVVWWEKARRAYMCSPVVRNLIGRRIFIEDQEKYIDAHKKSLQMYWSWAEKFPKLSEEYMLEILFHIASIYEAGLQIEYLEQGFKDVLDFVRSNLTIERRNILLEQAKDDQELQGLIPPDEYRGIEECLKEMTI